MDEYGRDGLVVHCQRLTGVVIGGAPCFGNAGSYTDVGGCLAELFGRHLLDVHEIADESEYLRSESEF